MQIDLKLYLRQSGSEPRLVTVRATLADDCLSEDGGGAAHVEEIQMLPPIGLRLGGSGRQVAFPLSSEAELAANDAVEEICRVAAALTGKPWSGPLPQWARTSQGPFDPDLALSLAVDQYSHHAEWRYEDDHPTGPSDAETYRKEAPYG